MNSPDRAPIFKPLPIEIHQALTESLLTAWMDKNLQYPIAKYLPVGVPQYAYTPRRAHGDIGGGNMWEMRHDNSVMPASRPNSSGVCRHGELHSPTVMRVSNITNTSGSALRRDSSLEIKWRSMGAWILAGVSTKTSLSGQRWSLTVGPVTIGGLLFSVALSF
jgi:hypothetical protein